MQERAFTGRKKITTHLTLENLKNDDVLLKVLNDAYKTHTVNVEDISYLENYIKGNQPILKRIKRVRQDIVNNIVENHALNIVNFKTGYIFGEPLRYVHKSEGKDEDIAELNVYMNYLNKSYLDSELAEWLFSFGVGYRFVKLGNSKDVPFEIINIHPKKAFTIYYDGFSENEQIATVIAMKKQIGDKLVDYFKVYTDDEIIECTLSTVIERIKNPLKMKQLIEYKINAYFLGSVEIVMWQLNALNTLTSGEIDDVEQFVQSMIVFFNTNVNEKTFKTLLEVGALNVSDMGKNKADVKMLSNKLDHSGIKILYSRILNNIATIVGMPKTSEKASGGDTGQAIMTRDGWNTAELKAKQDELNFSIGERQLLKLIKIISDKYSLYQNLDLKRLSIKFTRNRNDNLLVKMQSLQLASTGVLEPTIAFQISGLFDDPNEAVQKCIEYYGDTFWKVKPNNEFNIYNEEHIIQNMGNNTNITDFDKYTINDKRKGGKSK